MRLNLIPEVFDPTTGCYIEATKYFDEEDERQKDEVHAQMRKLKPSERARNSGFAPCAKSRFILPEGWDDPGGAPTSSISLTHLAALTKPAVCSTRRLFAGSNIMGPRKARCIAT